MNRFLVAASVASACTALLAGAAFAAGTPTPSKPAAAAGATAAKKPAGRKPAPKAAPAPPAPEIVPPPADEVQIAAAERVLYGEYHCEFNQTINVARSEKYEHYVEILFDKQHWTMKPVVSPIGAVRLEDVGGRTLMIQIAYKSMLMDVQLGQRLVDECIHEAQAAAKLEADRLADEAARAAVVAAKAASAAEAAAETAADAAEAAAAAASAAAEAAPAGGAPVTPR